MRTPHTVVFRFYTPAEGNIVIDADSPDHAKVLVGALINERYKEAEIVDAYAFETAVDDELDPYFKAKQTKRLN